MFATRTDMRGVETGRFEPGRVGDHAGRASTTGSPRTCYRLTPSIARTVGEHGRARPARGPGVADRARDRQHRRRGRPAARDRGGAAMSAVSTRQRPQLLGGDVRRFWSLTWTLAVTDWKLRFYGSVLGSLWSLARPFAFFGVIYVVFTEIAKIGDDVKQLRRLHPVLDRAVPVLRARRRARPVHVAGRAREPAAQDPLPAAGDPAVASMLDRAVQPRHDAGRGRALRGRLGRLSRLGAGSSCCCWSR